MAFDCMIVSSIVVDIDELNSECAKYCGNTEYG